MPQLEQRISVPDSLNYCESLREKKKKRKTKTVLMSKAQRPAQDVSHTRMKKKKIKIERTHTPPTPRLPTFDPKTQWSPEKKPRENLFPDLNPTGVWFMMCGQQTTQESGERGLTFPFFNTIPIWPMPSMSCCAKVVFMLCTVFYICCWDFQLYLAALLLCFLQILCLLHV